jgi:hypothetical protein
MLENQPIQSHRSSSRWNLINARRFKSTSDHRNSQRAIAATELLNSSIIAPISASATLPLKLSQFFLSTHALFKPKITSIERTAHIMQASISLAQTIMLAIIFFDRLKCSSDLESSELNCNILSFLGFIYNATLLAGWVPAEVGKEPHEKNNESTMSNLIRQPSINSNSSPSLEPDEEQKFDDINISDTIA